MRFFDFNTSIRLTTSIIIDKKKGFYVDMVT
jgi:hypothetical protein